MHYGSFLAQLLEQLWRIQDFLKEEEPTYPTLEWGVNIYCKFLASYKEKKVTLNIDQCVLRWFAEPQDERQVNCDLPN